MMMIVRGDWTVIASQHTVCLTSSGCKPDLMPPTGVADLRAAVEEGQMRMQGAVEGASEDVARHEREIADKRVVAAEKDILLQSQM